MKRQPKKARSNDALIAIFHCKGGPMKHKNTPRGGSSKEDYLDEWYEESESNNSDSLSSFLSLFKFLIPIFLLGCAANAQIGNHEKSYEFNRDEIVKINDKTCTDIFVVSGQSLGSGARSDTTPRTPITKLNNKNHLMISNQFFEDGTIKDNSSWNLELLTNPMRKFAGMSSYPLNVWDESISASFAERIIEKSYKKKAIHINVAVSGAPLYTLGSPESNEQKSFWGFGKELEAIKRLKPEDCFKFEAILMVHGESDNGNHNYQNELFSYKNLLNDKFDEIMGYSGSNAIMIFTQPSSRYPTTTGSYNTTSQDMIDLSEKYPNDFYLAGSKLNLQYDGDDFHLDPYGTRQLGYLYADGYINMKNKSKSTTNPQKISREGNVIHIEYDDDVYFDCEKGKHHQNSFYWSNGGGFELKDAYDRKLKITNSSSSGKVVSLEFSSNASPAEIYVSYASILEENEIDRGGCLESDKRVIQFLSKVP